MNSINLKVNYRQQQHRVQLFYNTQELKGKYAYYLFKPRILNDDLDRQVSPYSSMMQSDRVVEVVRENMKWWEYWTAHTLKRDYGKGASHGTVFDWEPVEDFWILFTPR